MFFFFYILSAREGKFRDKLNRIFQSDRNWFTQVCLTTVSEPSGSFVISDFSLHQSNQRGIIFQSSEFWWPGTPKIAQ